MRKILITGSTGFIGKNLTEYFYSKDYDVYTPTHNELDLLDSNKVSKYLKENLFDTIIHCATWDAKDNSNKDLTLVLDHNLRMYFNIIKEQLYFNKLILFGSGAEYSRLHWKSKMSESYFNCFIPEDAYGFSKYIIRKDMMYRKNVLNLCLFGVYGPYEDIQTRFISHAINCALNNKSITIRKDVVFDYMHVNDLNKIVEYFINNTNNKNNIYNVCIEQGYLLSELAEIVLKLLDKNLPIFIENSEFGNEYTGDNTLLYNEIPNLKFTNMQDGIKTYIDWYINTIEGVK